MYPKCHQTKIKIKNSKLWVKVQTGHFLHKLVLSPFSNTKNPPIILVMPSFTPSKLRPPQKKLPPLLRPPVLSPSLKKSWVCLCLFSLQNRILRYVVAIPKSVHSVPRILRYVVPIPNFRKIRPYATPHYGLYRYVFQIWIFGTGTGTRNGIQDWYHINQ